MQKLRYLQGACTLAIIAGTAWALGADHLDAPTVKMDAAGDITDVYSWVAGEKLTMILNVSPLATTQSKFSDAVQYVFHTESSAGYGKAGTKTDIVCTFDAAQAIDCVLGAPGGNVADFVKGNANTTNGITSDTLKMKVYAGLRADPFYFNLAGFNDAVATVKGAAGGLTFDGAGCPALNAATSTLLIGMLQGTMMGAGAPANFFEKVNVLSIVMEVDKTLVNGGGDTIAIWGSTNMGGM